MQVMQHDPRPCCCVMKPHRFSGDLKCSPLCGALIPRKTRYVARRDCTDDPAKVRCERCIALQAYGLKEIKK